VKVALVHDYLTTFGGGERVLTALMRVFPQAPIYTAVADFNFIKTTPELKNAKIISSWFNRLPFANRLLSPLRFLLPFIWESFNLTKFDLVIISSAAMNPRGILTKPKTKVIAYIHTPPRNLYGYDTGSLWRKYKIVRIYGRFINHFLRIYDFYTAQKPDILIANSKTTAGRIKKFWRREAKVIHPPVKIPTKKQILFGPPISILPQKFRKNSFYLTVSRLQYAKRVDLIVKTFNRLKKPLIVVGDGEELKRGLKNLNTSPNTIFTGFVPEKYLPWFYQNAKAFIFAAKDEDFGIAPVEAQGYGLPVIAHHSGGVRETVIEGKTGAFFKYHTAESLIKAIKRLDKYLKQGKIKPKYCQKNAQQFSEEKFIKKIRQLCQN